MLNKNDYYIQGTNGEAVLLCHSLGRDVSDMLELANELNKNGYSVSIPLYPGHEGGFNDIIKTKVSMWYKKIENEYDKLAENHNKVFASGMSIGGTFAFVLAQNRDVDGIATINAPIIPFDLDNDLKEYRKSTSDKESILLYEKHRKEYFNFVYNICQKENMAKVTAPIFVLQGALDKERYKISSSMILTYTNAKIKQRKDYRNSGHLLLLEKDKNDAIKDIANFFTSLK